MTEATLQYVRQHADDDVRQLALRGTKDPEVDLPMALQQIAGRQTARRKLPSWAALENIVYPPHLNMEQCSSEQTARYKAALCRRLLQQEQGTAESHGRSSLLDLTGGFGVDFSWMSSAFDDATYVERNRELCALSTVNFKVLGLNVETRNDDAVDYLHQLGHATMIFLDPARRDDHGGRTYGIADCMPNVLQLRDELLEKTDYLVLKLSPMLDWRKAVSDLGEPFVSEVHIVSVQNECKELLLVLTSQSNHTSQFSVLSSQLPSPLSPRLFCVNDDTVFEASFSSSPSNHIFHLSSFISPLFLYEPNASIMKAGCFDALSAAFGVSQVAPNSHLFVSDRLLTEFPGRKFRIEAVSTMNKRELKEKIQTLKQANITVRNFPLSVAELRKRLKLSDGGSSYLFATTLTEGDRVLIVCQRA